MEIEVNKPVVFNNINQHSVLKGQGLQKVVKEIKKDVFLEKEDLSIKRIFKEEFKVQDLPDIFYIKIDFKINESQYQSGAIIFKKDIISGDLRSKVFVDKNEYLRCSNKYCLYNSQLSFKLIKNKKLCCMKCGQPLKTKNIKQYNFDYLIFSDYSQEDIFSYLSDNDYISKFSKPTKKRLDFFNFFENEIIITDCKNKSNTNLSQADVKTASWYVFVVRKYLDFLKNEKKLDYLCNKLIIVKKGYFSDDLKNPRDRIDLYYRMALMHNINLEIIDINDFVSENKTSKGFLNTVSCEYKEVNNKWTYVWTFKYDDYINSFKIDFISIKKVKDYYGSNNRTKDKKLKEVEAIEEGKLKQIAKESNISKIDEYGFVTT
jgi:hypothetical protein